MSLPPPPPSSQISVPRAIMSDDRVSREDVLLVRVTHSWRLRLSLQVHTHKEGEGDLQVKERSGGMGTKKSEGVEVG